MSDTRRYVTPGWNQNHPQWCFDEMTEKYQSRDRESKDGKKHHRFDSDLRNNKANLLKKINDLSLKEKLES